MADGLTFDDARHEYRFRGRLVPSVTQVLGILQDFGGVSAEVLARAAAFGSHVHEAIDLWNDGLLDESTLDPALVPYLGGWRKFLEDTGAKVIESELRLADAKFGFAGTLDSTLEMRRMHTLCDVKSGLVPRTVGPQLAAYQHLYHANDFPRIRRRLCVQLTGDGYRIHEQNNSADWSVFLSALNCWRFRNAA